MRMRLVAERILAIDQAGTSGFAWTVDGGETRRSSVITLDKKLPRHLRLRAFRLALWAKIRDVKPEFIIHELPNLNRNLGYVGHMSMIGYLAIIELACAEHELGPPYTVNAMTLKKYATGNGRADKEDMVAAAKARQWRIDSHDEADALWILEYALKGEHLNAAAKRPKSNRKRAAKPAVPDDSQVNSARPRPRRREPRFA